MIGRAKVQVAYRQPRRLGDAVVAEIGLYADRLILVSDGVVVLDTEASLVACAEVWPIASPVRDAALVRDPEPEEIAEPVRDGTPWESDETEQLGRFWRAGHDTQSLATMFSRSEAAVTALLVDLGLLRPDGSRHEDPVTS